MSTGGDNLAIFTALAAPFESQEVRSRNQGGRDVQYITARTAMNRLDEALGPENWSDDYQPLADGEAVICRLTITLPDGRKVMKTDVGGMSDTKDSSDCEKSGFSDAFKRAAVKFGVGRYLYGDGVPRMIREQLAADRLTRTIAHAGNNHTRHPGEDDGPIPSQSRQPAPSQPRRDYGGNGQGGGNGGYGDRPPTTGKALFAWCMKQKEATGADIVGIVNDHGKSQRWPKKMIDWDSGQVADAHAEAVAAIDNLQNAGAPPKPARQPAPSRPLSQADVEAEGFSQVGPDDPSFIPF